MKTFYAVLVAVSLAVPTIASAINIDGVADADYGSAIVTQQLSTIAGDNTETNQGIANGSELDAAYGFVSNGVLYLVIAGNFDSDPAGPSQNDYLSVFMMTGPGGDHTLGTNYTATYNGRINRMGVGGAGQSAGAPGLTFDTNFTPNHWFGVNVGYDENLDATNTMFVDYQQVCSNCPSAYFGSVTSTNLPPNNVLLTTGQGNPNLNNIRVSLNNSNTNGVHGADSCNTNTYAVGYGPADVRSGVEFAIPLVAIGNPTGQVLVCAFLTTKHFDTIYNQVLGPVTTGPGGCQSFLGTSPGDPATVDFSTYPGQHYFSLPVPACDVILANPGSAAYTKTGGVGSVTAAVAGGCSLTVTSTAPWLTITSQTGLNTGNGSFTYLVATNSSINTLVGTFIITDSTATESATSTVTITETGVAAPPLGLVVTDGTVDKAYGCPITVQTLATQFGDSVNGDLANAVGGSELDSAYGIVQNNVLFLVFTGNMEGNGNKLDIFLQTGPGGQNTLTNSNPNFSNLNRMGYHGSGTNPGLTFDAGFAPNYCIMLNDFAGTCYADYAQLWPGGTNNLGVATNGYYLGSSTPTNGTVLGGTNPFGIQFAINDSNTNGVDGGTCTTNATGQIESTLAAPVRTGVELAIPLGAIGSPTGAIAVCAFVNSGDQTFLSNQVLPPVTTNGSTVCVANLGESTLVNFGTFPGRHYFLVGPEQRVTGITKSGSDINVSWLTETSSNFVYQLQSTRVLTTNTVWTSVGSPTNGTGLIITQTDPNAATNKPALFYRVQQTPACQ